MLGAGPAGLGAAHQLASRGFAVVVLEQHDRVGGLAGSFRVAGQSVDFGSHRLHVSTPPSILRLLAGLLGDELQLRQRNGRIRLEERWLSFPLRPANLVRAVGPRFLGRAGVSAAAGTLRRHNPATFATYVRTGLGEVMGDVFYYPYATKIWGLRPDQLSGEQARRRISADTPLKLLRRVLTRGDGSRGYFYYPAGGFGRISEVLADAATGQGADIRLGHGVDRIAFDEDGIRVVTASGAEFQAGQVWSTIPLTRLAALVDAASGGPSQPHLEYRAMLLVYLVVPVDRYSPFDAHYLPAATVPATRVSEPKNYRDGPDPEGQTVLCVEIPCWAGDEMWSMSDDDLGLVAAEALRASGLPDPQPTGIEVRRLPSAYPVYRIGYEDQLRPLLDWVTDQSGLVTLGRQGLFAHDNTHHALAMAWAGAEAVADDGSFDEREWCEAVASFGSNVVED